MLEVETSQVDEGEAEELHKLLAARGLFLNADELAVVTQVIGAVWAVGWELGLYEGWRLGVKSKVTLN